MISGLGATLAAKLGGRLGIWGGLVLLLVAMAAWGAWQRGTLHAERAERAEERAAVQAEIALRARHAARAAEKGAAVARRATRRARSGEAAALERLRALDTEIATDDPCRALLDARICPAVAEWMLDDGGAGRPAPSRAPGAPAGTGPGAGAAPGG